MANIEPVSNERANAAYLAGIAEMAAAISPTLFVTLAYNRAVIQETVASDLTYFLGCMDSELLGSKWASRPAVRRTRHISILENPRTNPHIHMLVAPADGKVWEFTKLVELFWKKVVPSGSIDVQPITNLVGAVNYVAKHLSAGKGDRLILTPGKA